MHRKVAAALLAVLALGAAGCGGSEEQLTGAQLKNRIQTACRQAQERVDDEANATDGFLAAALVAQRQLVRRIEALEPPDELSDAVESLQQGLDQRNEVIARMVAAPRSEQGRVMRAAEMELTETTRSIEAALRRLNVRECS